jgi:hypothetical protein
MPEAVVLVETRPPFSIVTTGAVRVIWPALPVAPKSLLLLTAVSTPEIVADSMEVIVIVPAAPEPKVSAFKVEWSVSVNRLLLIVMSPAAPSDADRV